MKSIKYKLFPEGSECSFGTTDLRASLGQPIEIEGCVVLLCVEGMAVLSYRFSPALLSPGRFAGSHV